MSDFRNVAPSDREARRATMSKETQEKARLAARRGGHQRYEDIGNPVMAAPGTAQYMEEAHRFQTDAAFEEKQEREARLRKQEALIVQKREMGLRQEEERWQKFDEAQREEQEKMEAKVGTNKSNFSSVAYDPLTLAYKDDAAGDGLRYSDDMHQYRKDVRKSTLASKQHSTAFNPLTGEPLRVVTVMDRPTAPQPREHTTTTPYRR